MTLDEQMAEIERLTKTTGGLFLPYTLTNIGVVDDASEHITSGYAGDEQCAYLVACANAAPALMEEVRRLRQRENEWGMLISQIQMSSRAEELEELRNEIANIVRLNDENEATAQFDVALETLFDKFRDPYDRVYS